MGVGAMKPWHHKPRLPTCREQTDGLSRGPQAPAEPGCALGNVLSVGRFRSVVSKPAAR